MAKTTTIRLPPRLRARVHALAKQSGRSAHGFILEAVRLDEVRVLAIRQQREIGFVP